MKVLCLDSDFTIDNEKKISYSKFKFPAGEINIRIESTVSDDVTIVHRVTSSDHIMEILIAKDALDRLGCSNVNLFIPYLPYARQDRVCNEGESLSIAMFAKLINNAGFKKVSVLDAHSDVGPALINNCVNLSYHSYVFNALSKINHSNNLYTINDIVIVSPDSGANKKINKLNNNLNLEIVRCDKVRNVNTGDLSNFQVLGKDLDKSKPYLIVDDICDGGRTFIGLSKALKEKGAENIYLYVTHGIFSNGFEELKESFNHIFTTNSYKNINNDLITQYKII
jgi:ribose-phosphate pyrophosphokinase